MNLPWKEAARRYRKAFIKATTPEIVEMHMSNGRMETLVDGKYVTRILASAFWDLIAENDAPNYVEMTIGKDGKELIITVQKRNGKTPHQLREEAEEKLAICQKLSKPGEADRRGEP